MYRKLKTILYHGTITEIQHIDVTLGRGRKDFGKGFYMAVSKKQAVGMMHKKYREAIRRNRHKQELAFSEKLYEITLDEQVLLTLNLKIFECADLTWLDFILACREHGGTPHDFDMVVGPTADDDTALCLKAYQDGLYGKAKDARAKQILLDNLETEHLGIQYFIGKQDIANKLIKHIREIDWK